MANFLCKTKGDSSPEHKPRVYFTCHPDDFSKYFEDICKDIFKDHNCAVYYTEDMTEEIEEKYKESDLGQMNLFVIPVTFKLLNETNRAMNSDFLYAKDKRIPILPIMMEPGLDMDYSREDKFGEMQYLDPFTYDKSAISYAEKLKKYLNSVLISDETAKRIRKAFDAYVFLSYRKKDRHYANELMKMIHSYPEFRDVAIWYDEFLIPGESFRESIKKMMLNSKMFALLVTPNLLEYVGGEPNYVMANEYPDAKSLGINILPAEMEKTDKDALRLEYEGIPECVDPKEDVFKNILIDTLSRTAVLENNSDPEHTFLIGLAYLDGIDVETNKERGIKLITDAAEAGQLEAMEKLYEMYLVGIGVQVDYQKTLYWAKRIVEYNKDKNGERHPDTISAMNDLCKAYFDLGYYKDTIALAKNIYALSCEILGEKHQDSLTALTTVAAAHCHLGNYREARRILEKAYELSCNIYGEEDNITLQCLDNLSVVLGDLGRLNDALVLLKKAYSVACKIYGVEHRITLQIMDDLATVYGNLQKKDKQLELSKSSYEFRCALSGEGHPDSLMAMGNLAWAYFESQDYTKALELNQKAYELSNVFLGEKHPQTLTLLNALAITYGKCKDQKKELSLLNKGYKLICDNLDSSHPYTLKMLNNLARAYFDIKNYKESLRLFEKSYKMHREVYGEGAQSTILVMSELATVYSKVGYLKKALELSKKSYDMHRGIFDEESSEMMTMTFNLAKVYGENGNYAEEIRLLEIVYKYRRRTLGETHAETLRTLSSLAQAHGKNGDLKKTKELFDIHQELTRKREFYNE